uniref:Uncharacterized protein n=1 Tax=Phasianus colchicus TaxID=9054 RepID=A0A669PD25_PHACC
MGVVGDPIVCRCEESQREGRANRGAEWGVLPMWVQGSEHPFSMQKLLVCAISLRGAVRWWFGGLQLSHKV